MHAAIISDGSDAIDMVGQFSNYESPLIPYYDKGDTNNGPNRLGIESPQDTLLDTVNHRLFVADQLNDRILVYQLNAGTDFFDDYIPDYVLGQPDFLTDGHNTTIDGLSYPTSLAYDSTREYLFVADYQNSRVIVYDVDPLTIANGADAINVLGQDDFTSGSEGIDEYSLYQPTGLALNTGSPPTSLYVADTYNNRVVAYNIGDGISNGEAAVTVFGQPDFVTDTAGTTQTTMDSPSHVEYVPSASSIYVADYDNNRVLRFGIAGGAATQVLGQVDYVSSVDTQFDKAGGLYYDVTRDDLYVSSWGDSKVLYFDDVTGKSNGDPADAYLGDGNQDADNNSISYPERLSMDEANARLYVTTGDRVMIFSVPGIVSEENAEWVLGQYNESGTPVFDKNEANNGPNSYSFSNANEVVLDRNNNRLFVADGNNRILAFDLNENHLFDNYIADYVLGQDDFASTGTASTSASSISRVYGLEYDHNNDRLFASDSDAHRILVFNNMDGVLSDNMPADNVLGQSNFTNGTSATSISRLNYPGEIAYDGDNEKLYVSDEGNNRVVVYDVDPGTISNGSDAENVLGQGNFTSSSSGTTSTTMDNPNSVSYDTTREKLFVSDRNNNRVLVFDFGISPIGDGRAADFVIGQSDFISSSSTAPSATGFNYPTGLTFDEVTDRLFVSQFNNQMVQVFDVSNITNGEAAINVLGSSSLDSYYPDSGMSGLRGPYGLDYDPITAQLYVADYSYNRVMVFEAGATNSAPTGTFNSAVQGTDGTGDVAISIEVDDINNDATMAKLEYETDEDGVCDGPWGAANLTGPAIADFDDAGGAPDIGVGGYQVGATATTRITTIDGSNSVAFTWDSPTDLATADSTQCLRLTVNDDTVDSTPTTQTLTVDNINPTASASLAVTSTTTEEINIRFGAAGSDTNIDNYKIYYKEDSSGVTELDDLAETIPTASYSEGSTDTISGLSPGTTYVLNIWTYDAYGNSANATEVTATTKEAPTGTFNSAVQDTDGTGNVVVSIEIDDADNDDTKAKIEYESDEDGSCNGPWEDATLTGTATADFDDSGGAPSIGTGSYQIGSTATKRIMTSSGSNSIVFSWDSATDLATADGTQCLQLTVNDDEVDSTEATQTLTVDNVAPTASAALTAASATVDSIILTLGAAGSDTNIDSYTINYKAGAVGVTSSDTLAEDMSTAEYVEGNSVTISDLTASTQYVINIWTYDYYGKSTGSTEVTATTEAAQQSSGGSSGGSAATSSNDDDTDDTDTDTDDTDTDTDDTDTNDDTETDTDDDDTDDQDDSNEDQEEAVEIITPIEDVIEEVIDDEEDDFDEVDDETIKDIIEDYEEEDENEDEEVEEEEDPIKETFADEDPDEEVLDEAQEIIEEKIKDDIKNAIENDKDGEIEIKQNGKTIKINSNSKIKIVLEKNKKALAKAQKEIGEDEIILVVNEKSNFDSDTISDMYQITHDLPLFNDNPDEDPFTNADEIFLGLDPLEADEIPDLARITNLDGKIAGARPSFRLTGEAGEKVEVILISKTEDGNVQSRVGETEIDEEYKGEIRPENELEDGEYYAIPRGEESGIGETISFTVDSRKDLGIFDLLLISEDYMGPAIKRSLLTASLFLKEFNADKYLAAQMEEQEVDKDTIIVKGTTEPGNTVLVAWKSVILSSVVVSDASQGAFQVEVPKHLADGEHEVIVYVLDEKNDIVGSVATLLFSK